MIFDLRVKIGTSFFSNNLNFLTFWIFFVGLCYIINFKLLHCKKGNFRNFWNDDQLLLFSNWYWFFPYHVLSIEMSQFHFELGIIHMLLKFLLSWYFSLSWFFFSIIPKLVIIIISKLFAIQGIIIYFVMISSLYDD